MLRPKEVGRPLMEATPSYSDPALGDKAVRVLLAYRQFKAALGANPPALRPRGSHRHREEVWHYFKGRAGAHRAV